MGTAPDKIVTIDGRQYKLVPQYKTTPGLFNGSAEAGFVSTAPTQEFIGYLLKPANPTLEQGDS